MLLENSLVSSPPQYTAPPPSNATSSVPARPVLERKLRDFYLEYDPNKANDMDKIISATQRNGVSWLQDGLARKYNGCTIDFTEEAPPVRAPPTRSQSVSAAQAPLAQQQAPVVCFVGAIGCGRAEI
jgi:hypothetical protein